MEMIQIECKACKKLKQLDEFNTNNKSRCKECWRLYQAQYWKKYTRKKRAKEGWGVIVSMRVSPDLRTDIDRHAAIVGQSRSRFLINLIKNSLEGYDRSNGQTND